MRLGEYLQLADISQTRFAAQIGVRRATISRYISGTKIPSATVVLKIRNLSKGAVALDDWAPEKKVRRRDALLPGV
jgi:transcriptional regulator with XRE-family HTH domain